VDAITGRTVAGTIKQARVDADIVRERFSDGCIPVRPEIIAANAKLDVLVADIPDENFAGYYQDGKIYLNSLATRPRLRMTLAHEIGHWWDSAVMGRRPAVSTGSDPSRHRYVRRSSTDIEDAYADEFALSLLMPEDLVRLAYEERLPARVIGELFDVSTESARNRIIGLDLI